MSTPPKGTITRSEARSNVRTPKMLNSTPTRNLKTEEAYENRVRQFRERAARIYGIDSHMVSPSQLVAVLVDQAATLRRPSWRQYRAALRFVLVRDAQDSTSPSEHHKAIALLDAALPRCVHKSLNTSASKAKRVAAADHLAIHRYLMKHDSDHKYAGLLGCFFAAAMITGLRPCEWEHASFDGRWLTCFNAKPTNGRANGPVRSLDLSGLAEGERDAIAVVIDRLKELTIRAPFAAIQIALSDYMRKVTRSALGPRKRYPTLYCARHQVTANLKKQGLPREIVAAILGHATDRTAGQNYGRAAVGRGSSKVLPAASAVATVRCVAASYEDRFRGGHSPG